MGGGRFEAVGCGGGAGGAGGGEEGEALGVVLVCDEGEDVEEGGGVGGAGLLGGRGVAEEEGDGVFVFDVGCCGGVVDVEAEEGGGGRVGGGGVHGGEV